MPERLTCRACHLVLGGARSGKTAYALSLAQNSRLEKWMIATALAGDWEMQERIARHREERGDGWHVVEEPLDIVGVLRAQAGPDRVLIVDCLTLWLSNLFSEGKDPAAETGRLTETIFDIDGDVIFVSNEIGLGLVPNSQLGRAFRDAQGHLNWQKLASACDLVSFVAAGLPFALKSEKVT